MRHRTVLDPRDARVFLAGAGSPRRAAVEAYVAERYREGHGAEVTRFLPTLMGIEAPGAGIAGAIGVREAAAEALYLEQYLDVPVERALARAVGCPARRDSVAEVGNLAGSLPGAGTVLIAAFAGYLDALGLGWAVFTGTRALRNAFEGGGRAPPAHLGPADPSRLPDGGASWGRYFATDPRVVAVRIPLVREACLHDPRLGERAEGLRASAVRAARESLALPPAAELA
jgi:hypothetical protein